MATGKSDSMSDEVCEIKCFLCAKEKRTRDADHYCMECKNYYCLPCVGIHKKIAAMQGHKILDKSDFKSLGKEWSLPSYPTQRCGKHPLEVVSLYCQDHDDVACGPCVALTHRSCKHIISIPDEIDTLYKRKGLTDTKQKLSKMKKIIEDIKVTKEDKIKKLKEALNEEIESVKAFKQELQALLDEIEEETITELRREFNKIEELLGGEVNEDVSLLSSLNEANSQLKMAEGNRAQEFVCIKISQKLTNQAEEASKNQLMTPDETIVFTPNQSIKVFLKQITAFGEIDQVRDSIYKIKSQKQIDVKLKKDKKTCDITGICVTDDSILLTDYDNKKLKRLYVSNEKVKDYIDFQAEPNAVCTISKTEVAVTLNNKSVTFVSLGDKMTATRTLTMDHKCRGLAHKDGKMFIGNGCTFVYIYNMNGMVQKIIHKDESGDFLFLHNNQIAVSVDHVFVSDPGYGVIVLDSQGNYLSTIKNDMDSGVCTDGRNVFVSNRLSYDILQFGKSYKMLGQVGKFNYIPGYLCFDHQRKRLIAALYNHGITVLELE